MSGLILPRPRRDSRRRGLILPPGFDRHGRRQMFVATQHAGFGASAGSGFTPDQVSGLQTWLDSELGVTKDGSDFVSNWADQSGNSRDLSEATNKPLWVASQVNGHPSIRFDGANDLLTSTAWTQAAAYTIFAVMNVITNTSPKRIFGGSAGTAFGQVLRGGSTINMNDSGVGDGPSLTNFTSGTWALGTFVVNGTSSTAARNDGADQTSATNVNDSLTTTFQLGTGQASSTFGNVEFAALTIYSGALSAGDQTLLKDYYNARYSLW